MTAQPVFRIHPSIGIARVGNSDSYYLAPETMAAAPQPGPVTGGLPIKAGTEADHITSRDIRDATGALRRQAARFRLFAYDAPGTAYPQGGGVEVKLGDKVGGRTVTDIVWTVHLANKKANCYVLEYPPSGLQSIISNYQRGLPPLRNPSFGDPDERERVRQLTIDPGPRCIRMGAGPVEFDQATTASWCDEGGVVHTLDRYPQLWPAFPNMYTPSGPLTTLGRLEVDSAGRLVVVAGPGRACAWRRGDGTPWPLASDVDNDGWFDDTGDGPVSAVVVFDQGPPAVAASAWVVATDPGYAPQVPNVVTLWDEVFDTWVRHLGLVPDLYTIAGDAPASRPSGKYQATFKPSFDDHVAPFLRAAPMQQWIGYLTPYAVMAHQAMSAIDATTDPSTTVLAGLGYIRNPNFPEQAGAGSPLMPLSLGDSGQPFLLPTLTQYFFLTQWNAGLFATTPLAMGPGERLDKASLYNCLGGRFTPGIDMTFIVRDPSVWNSSWQDGGPFRIKAAPLDYRRADTARPFLTQGYVPVHRAGHGLEPGDTSKFMALPWHTDYNSCATHPTSPNPTKSSTLYWSWPAQRPVSVYLASEVAGGQLADPRYSVRGPGTETADPSAQGRYQQRIEMVRHWVDIGTVIQGSAVDGGSYDPTTYLEVEGRLAQGANEAGPQPWPTNATPWPTPPRPPQEPLT